MKITQEETGQSGIKKIHEYEDTDSFADLPQEQCKLAHAVCFCGDKIVVVYHGIKKRWGLVGGSIEENESPEEGIAREIKEESNMTMTACRPIGYSKVTNVADDSIFYHLIYVATVEPDGPFVSDPSGDIVEIQFVAIDEYPQYSNWGSPEIRDSIIKRAKELLPKLQSAL
jgi:ADP-ribose pyrophosphatase YjhB (NUDIX family)